MSRIATLGRANRCHLRRFHLYHGYMRAIKKKNPSRPLPSQMRTCATYMRGAGRRTHPHCASPKIDLWSRPGQRRRRARQNRPLKGQRRGRIGTLPTAAFVCFQCLFFSSPSATFCPATLPTRLSMTHAPPRSGLGVGGSNMVWIGSVAVVTHQVGWGCLLRAAVFLYWRWRVDRMHGSDVI